MRLKLFKHVVWVCLEVIWGGLGCFNGSVGEIRVNLEHGGKLGHYQFTSNRSIKKRIVFSLSLFCTHLALFVECVKTKTDIWRRNLTPCTHLAITGLLCLFISRWVSCDHCQMTFLDWYPLKAKLPKQASLKWATSAQATLRFPIYNRMTTKYSKRMQSCLLYMQNVLFFVRK